MQHGIVSLVIACIAMAGCSSAAPDADSAPRTSTTAPTTEASTSTAATSGSTHSVSTSKATTVPPNQAPRLALTASDMAGPAPWPVNVTIVASDPDGPDVRWELDFGDGTPPVTGQDSPRTVAHTYTAPGNYTVTAVAVDAKGAKDTGDLLATVGKGIGQAETLQWLLGDGDSSTPLDLLATPVEGTDCTEGPEEGVSAASFTLDEATVGLPFAATITADEEGAILSWSLYFHNPDCTNFLVIHQADGPTPIEGIVPAGAHPFVYAASMGGTHLVVEYRSGGELAQ